jgi:hypothetical protein
VKFINADGFQAFYDFKDFEIYGQNSTKQLMLLLACCCWNLRQQVIMKTKAGFGPTLENIHAKGH